MVTVGLPLIAYISFHVVKYIALFISGLNPFNKEKSTYPVMVLIYIIGLFSIFWFWKNSDINVTRDFIEGVAYTFMMLYFTFMYSAVTLMANDENDYFD